MRLLSKLLLLVVVLLMPLAMAPLAAGSSPHHEMGADVPMGHCPDQGSGPHGKSGLTECTMACAAALPAANTHFGRVLVICEPVVPAATHRLDGLHPDTVTPPPKRS